MPIDYSRWADITARSSQATAAAISGVADKFADIAEKRKQDKDTIKAAEAKGKAVKELFGDQGGFLDSFLAELGDEELPISERAAMASGMNDLIAAGIDKFNTERDFGLKERALNENVRQFDASLQADNYTAQTKQQFDETAKLNEAATRFIAAKDAEKNYKGGKLPDLTASDSMIDSLLQQGNGTAALSMVEAREDQVAKFLQNNGGEKDGKKLANIAVPGGTLDVFVDDASGVITDLYGNPLNTEATMPEQFLPDAPGVLPARPDANEVPNYGNRPDGTAKGTGWLGELKLPNGSVATEYTTQSNAVQKNGQRIDFPTLVPTLSQEELDAMVNDIIPNQKPIPEPIMQKAIAHAKSRLAEGKSVFADERKPNRITPRPQIGFKPATAGTVKTPTEQAIDEARLAKLQGDVETRQIAQEKEKATRSAALENAEGAVKLINTLEKHPGFSGAVGMTATPGFLPATDRKGAEAIIDQLKGQAFLNSIQQLRGMGALSDAEGAKLQQAAARLNTSQSEKDFKAALAEYKQVVESGIGRLKKTLGEETSAAAKQPESAQDRLNKRRQGK